MPELKLKQIQYEFDTWKRTLEFIREENIHFKNRLSEILKDRFDRYLLEEADAFQSRFVKEDELIALLRNDIADLDKLLEREIPNDGKAVKVIGSKLKKIRNNLLIAEKRFVKLKSDFTSFLSENII